MFFDPIYDIINLSTDDVKNRSKNEKNQLYLEFPSIPSNESLARLIVAAFASALDPKIEEISAIKSAVTVCPLTE